MDAATFLNNLEHTEMQSWLKSALVGSETIPLLTPDESPYLAVLRLERHLKPHARDSLRDACRDLIGRFCAQGQGDLAFLQQLLGLASAFRDPETVAMLANLATRFPTLPHLSREIRLAVFATLVDTPPPQPPDFWAEILSQDPQTYAALALSGVLATHPMQAVQMLRAMPDTESMGRAAALKLELASDNLPPDKRFQFVQAVGRVLARCAPRFAGPVEAWVASQQSSRAPNPRIGLVAALGDALGDENSPKVVSARLRSRRELVAA
jgi:hypothetical protein